jgi:hypothetical protein
LEQAAHFSQEHAATGVLPAVLSAWDVLSWIAFRELRPRPDLPEAVAFTLTWGCSNPAQTLEALEARSSASPFCIWEPGILDGEKWDGHSFKHVACSPTGPKMLRWIVRQLRAKQGRVVPFREAADLLRKELEAVARYNAQVEEARRELITALRARTLTAWGKRDARHGEPTLAAEYEAIPANLFLDDLVSVSTWGTVGPDPEHPIAFFDYRGATFRDARFYAADVWQLWPVRKAHEATTVGTIANERKLVEWLTDLMRSTPNSSMSKAATKRAAIAAGLDFSARAFDRAWATAVRQSGATRWSKPGRKS